MPGAWCLPGSPTPDAELCGPCEGCPPSHPRLLQDGTSAPHPRHFSCPVINAQTWGNPSASATPDAVSQHQTPSPEIPRAKTKRPPVAEHPPVLNQKVYDVKGGPVHGSDGQMEGGLIRLLQTEQKWPRIPRGNVQFCVPHKRHRVSLFQKPFTLSFTNLSLKYTAPPSTSAADSALGTLQLRGSSYISLHGK